MNVSTAEPLPTSDPAAPSATVSDWARVAPFLLLWLLPCAGLSIHWQLNPQYHFGWFVPLFAGYTALGRWRTRPPPGAPVRGSVAACVLLALSLLPTWLVSRPSPDWPLVNWLLTSQVAALELCALAAIGGTRWARHFAVPVLLIFTAVPWPDAIEAPFIQGMMRAVASVGVGLLDLLGVAALRHGNLIEVATGTVGVDEACSGIRSLQGSLMASVVLGELFRFPLGRRVVLVVASIIAAFVTNVIRASFLAWSAAHSGLKAVDRWHDPAGMTILLICVGIILAIALYLDRDTPSPAAWSQVPRAARLPAAVPVFLGAWFVLMIAAVEAWYYDPSPAPESPWTIKAPSHAETIALPVVVRSVYHADEDGGASWKHADGTRWLMYFFEWRYGPSSSRVAAVAHSPELCLPASGRELEQDRGTLDVPVAGQTLPFRAYTFRDGDRPLFVYYGLWQFRSARAAARGKHSPYRRIANIQSVLWREARLGQQAAEIVVTGYRDAAQADAAFLEMIPQLIQPRPAPSVAGAE